MTNSHGNFSSVAVAVSNGEIRGKIEILTHANGRLLKKRIALARIAQLLGTRFDAFMAAMQCDDARVHGFDKYHSLAVINRNGFTRFDW